MQANIKIVKVDPVDPNSVYMAVDSFFYYSNDEGVTWDKKKLDAPVEQVYSNSALLKDEVYVFTQKAIHRFHKKAGTFTTHALPNELIPAFSFSAGTVKNSDSVIFYALKNATINENEFAYTNTEIWRSYDLGKTWEPATDSVITNTGKGPKPSLVKVVCSENDAANAYVVCSNYDEKLNDGRNIKWYGALKTANGGNNWNWVWKAGGGSGRYGVHDAGDASNFSDAWVQSAFGKEFILLIDAGVHPQNGSIAVVTDWYRSMKTEDGGLTWKEIYSREEKDRSYTTRGLDVTTAYGVHFDPFDSLHIAISYTDIGYHHSYDGGRTWKRSVEGVPGDWVNTCYWIAFDPDIKGRVYSVWSGNHDIPRGKMTRNPRWKEENFASGGVCVSDDGGQTWKSISNGMGTNSITTSIVLDKYSPVENRTLYAAVYNKGVFKSTDAGKTWQLKNNGIGENTCAFEITLASNGHLYLVVSPTPAFKDGKRGREYLPGAVYKSTDAGESWKQIHITDGLIFPNGIDVDPDNPDKLYLAAWSEIHLSDLIGAPVAKATGGNEVIPTPGGVYASDDGGATWRLLMDKTRHVYDITVDPIHPGRLYCNTFNRAAYRSDDYGKTWKKLAGYDFHWGQRVLVDRVHPEKVYVTTFGSSVWHGTPVAE